MWRPARARCGEERDASLFSERRQESDGHSTPRISYNKFSMSNSGVDEPENGARETDLFDEGDLEEGSAETKVAALDAEKNHKLFG